MKFEANLPSYLKFGSGAFPVGERSTSKRKQSTNFYEQAKQGFNLPMTNEDNIMISAPQEDAPIKDINFFESMQNNMQAKGPSKPIPGQQPLPFPEEPDPMDDDLPTEVGTDEFIG